MSISWISTSANSLQKHLKWTFSIYVHPISLTAAPTDPLKPWFANVPYGENKLSSMVKDMCAAAQITGKTNHSLRATGTTALFSGNCPEKVIQEHTGHRSLKALRMYERTTEKQHQVVSKMLTSSEEVEYRQQKEVDVTASTSANSLATGQSPFQISSLFGATTNCVINVNFAPSNVAVKYAQEEFEYELPPGLEDALGRDLEL